MGTNGQIQSIYHDNKPTYNANATWVHGEAHLQTWRGSLLPGSSTYKTMPALR